MRKTMLAANLLAILMTESATLPVQSAEALRPVSAPASFDGDLSILSYNVKGLPWPIASGRTEALQAIGYRLAAMRATGTQPHIMMLQEAFTDEAKAIGKIAGYRYSVTGPSSTDTAAAAATDAQKDFAEVGDFWKGETEGKWQDSGLEILSDYPIVAVKRMAFPAYACAGYDCLANKGVLVAWVKIPGIEKPIAIADTHLNSRKATKVDPARADAAFGMQLAAARDFIAKAIPLGDVAILGGDFNIGHIAAREKAERDAPVLPNSFEALALAANTGLVSQDDTLSATALIKKHKDMLFARSNALSRLALQSLSVPFGISASGKSLSDHMGYIAHYRMVALK